MVKISADSTCDLSPSITKEFDIGITPLSVIVGDQQFQDGVSITPSEIFKYVEKDGKVCRTSAINVYDYQHYFAELSSNYDAVIHICLGSKFSSCYQNASLAAQAFKNVYVIDSQNLSTGSGQLVYEAALLARENMTAEAICQRLRDLIPKVRTSFIIDRLDYLRNGGRCSALAAQGAKILQIKPCIEVVDGQMIVGKKYRGTLEKCLKNYVKDKLQDRNDIDLRRIFITHTVLDSELVMMVKEEIKKYSDFQDIIITDAGSTVACHCGPNTLGILFILK